MHVAREGIVRLDVVVNTNVAFSLTLPVQPSRILNNSPLERDRHGEKQRVQLRQIKPLPKQRGGRQQNKGFTRIGPPMEVAKQSFSLFLAHGTVDPENHDHFGGNGVIQQGFQVLKVFLTVAQNGAEAFFKRGTGNIRHNRLVAFVRVYDGLPKQMDWQSGLCGIAAQQQVAHNQFSRHRRVAIDFDSMADRTALEKEQLLGCSKP